jgi:hypothetical protein
MTTLKEKNSVLLPSSCSSRAFFSFQKNLKKIYINRPNEGIRLVFEFFSGSYDFIMQKVYLLLFMPVCVGLIMLAAYFFHSY